MTTRVEQAGAASSKRLYRYTRFYRTALGMEVITTTYGSASAAVEHGLRVPRERRDPAVVWHIDHSPFSLRNAGRTR